jgi:hypothetical protein
MARCFICQAETKSGIGEATVREGWTFTEARGKHGNKYGVFCPEHSLAEMREVVGLLLERAVLPEGKRSAASEKVKHVPGAKEGVVVARGERA